MSLKERFKEGIERIAAPEGPIDAKVVAFVGEEFRRFLSEGGEEGSARDAAALAAAKDEALSGVEAGLASAGRSSYALVAECADTISDAIRERVKG